MIRILCFEMLPLVVGFSYDFETIERPLGRGKKKFKVWSIYSKKQDSSETLFTILGRRKIYDQWVNGFL